MACFQHRHGTVFHSSKFWPMPSISLELAKARTMAKRDCASTNARWRKVNLASNNHNDLHHFVFVTSQWDWFKNSLSTVSLRLMFFARDVLDMVLNPGGVPNVTRMLDNSGQDQKCAIISNQQHSANHCDEAKSCRLGLVFQAVSYYLLISCVMSFLMLPNF